MDAFLRPTSGTHTLGAQNRAEVFQSSSPFVDQNDHVEKPKGLKLHSPTPSSPKQNVFLFVCCFPHVGRLKHRAQGLCRRGGGVETANHLGRVESSLIGLYRDNQTDKNPLLQAIPCFYKITPTLTWQTEEKTYGKHTWSLVNWYTPTCSHGSGKYTPPTKPPVYA